MGHDYLPEAPELSLYQYISGNSGRVRYHIKLHHSFSINLLCSRLGIEHDISDIPKPNKP